MNYEQKYKEALEMAKVAALNGHQNLMEGIFPELKESEDEKVRKMLIKFFGNGVEYNSSTNGIFDKDIVAWLEKQGEQKPNPYSGTSFEYNGHTWGMCARDNGVDILFDKKLVKHISGEKQSEQKPYGQREECLDCQFNYAGECKGSCAMKRSERKPADKVEPLDEFSGLTDFERTLADICIGWIGKEIGWKQYIKDNADALLQIAVEKFNSVQDVTFEQKAAWSEEDEEAIGMAIIALEDMYDEDEPNTTYGGYNLPFNKAAERLKSIKQRIGG